MPDALEAYDYPTAAALAYLFFCSFVASRLFVTLKLPGAVGIIGVGFLFKYLLQDEILTARDELQELAFFLVLLTAGLEIALSDLNRSVMTMAILPVSLEMCGLTLCGHYWKGCNWTQSAVIGCTLSGLGDGLVIPKMKEFTTTFVGHTMPRLVFTWCPLEAAFVLTLFGVLTPFAEPETVTVQSSTATILGGNALIILATVFGGILLGTVCGWFVMHRTLIVINGRKMFNGTAVEAFLIVMACALLAFGLGQNFHSAPHAWIPVGFISGSLFQKELMVIVVGASFAAYVGHDDETLHGVEMTLGGVWVFGQLILFTMLGSKMNLHLFDLIVDVIPFFASGLSCRLLGCFVGMSLTSESLERPKGVFFFDVIFCFVSTLPRATLQGALAGLPLRKKLFSRPFQACNKELATLAKETSQWRQKNAECHALAGFAADLRVWIAGAGGLYILLCSIIGSILLDTLGRYMLTKSADPLDADAIGKTCTMPVARLARVGTIRELDTLNQLESAEVVPDGEGSQSLQALWQSLKPGRTATMTHTPLSPRGGEAAGSYGGRALLEADP